jgi:hypothetical protein
MRRRKNALRSLHACSTLRAGKHGCQCRAEAAGRKQTGHYGKNTAKLERRRFGRGFPEAPLGSGSR